MIPQAEYIAGPRDQALVPERLDMPGAQPFDVERIARNEVLQAFDGLRGTDQPAGAAADGFAFLASRQAAAFGAIVRKLEGLRGRRTFALDHRYDLGNDIAGALDDDRIALADLLAGDLVLVVERRPADHDAADRDGTQVGHRGERAGAADLDRDRFEHGLRPLGGKFMGDGPARRTADIAEPPLPVEPVDLVDHAVDVVVEVRACLGYAPVQADRLFRAPAQLGRRVDREAPRPEVCEVVPVGVPHGAVEFAETVGEEAKRAGGGNRRVELPQGTGRSVARVRERRLARLFAPPVEREKIFLAHIDLAAHLQDGGRAAGEPVGHVAHRPEVAGDVLAHGAVAPRRAENESAVLVAQRNRQPVDLGLRHDLHRLVGVKAEETAHAGIEVHDVFGVERVAERKHGRGVGDLRETGGGRGADPARRAVVAHQVGETGLYRVVAAAQRVVFRVRHLGSVAPVIALVVVGDLVRQPLELGFRLGAGQGVGVLRAAHGASPAMRLSAAARASSVTLMPASMRAISSRRVSRSSSSTTVLVSCPPGSRVSRLRTRQ